MSVFLVFLFPDLSMKKLHSDGGRLKKILCNTQGKFDYANHRFAISLKKQAISRILSCPIIYLGFWLPKTSNRLPSSMGVQPLPLVYMAFHRIEFT